MQTTEKTVEKKSSFSIDHILPKDIIQHILSFQIWTSASKAVNKLFRDVAEQNERNHYLELIKTIDESSPIPYNDDINNTWIIDPKVRPLTKIEENLGFKESFDHLYYVLHEYNLKPGDRILLHDGFYEVLDEWHIRDISIIGIGNSAVIGECHHSSIGETMLHVGNVYLQNLKLQRLDKEYDCVGDAMIEIQFGRLCLNKCELKSYGHTIIMVPGNTYLSVDNCGFAKASTAITISPFANEINVTNNRFSNHGSENQYAYSGECGCIIMDEIIIQNTSYRRSCQCESESFVKLNCEANVFEDNSCLPICERCGCDETFAPVHVPMYIDKKELYTLKNNVLRGHNGSKEGNSITDANVLYFINEKFKFLTV